MRLIQVFKAIKYVSVNQILNYTEVDCGPRDSRLDPPYLVMSFVPKSDHQLSIKGPWYVVSYMCT